MGEDKSLHVVEDRREKSVRLQAPGVATVAKAGVNLRESRDDHRPFPHFHMPACDATMFMCWLFVMLPVASLPSRELGMLSTAIMRTKRRRWQITRVLLQCMTTQAAIINVDNV